MSKSIRDSALFKLFLSTQAPKITEEEVDYFSKNPDEIEEYFSSINIHLFFLLIGTVFGTGIVVTAKFIEYSSLKQILSDAIFSFLVDITFEVGVALIGASVTAFLLGTLLNRQQENARRWRKAIRRRIRTKNGPT